MVNLSKVVGDFIGAQKSINAQLSQRIDSVESSLNKKMDGVQSDLSQKIDNLQYSISRFANLNKVQEKENSPSQPHQNQKGIHEMEAEERDKEVDLPTFKLDHEVESETEKEKREEIKGKKKGKSIEKDDYIQGEPQRIVIKEEMMKLMPPPFTQALYGKIIQSKSQVRDANFIWDPGKPWTVLRLSKALDMLEGDVEPLQLPPKPSFYYLEISALDQENKPMGVLISSHNASITISLDGR
ncbi:hypothetical protein CK203_093598 [Vitis vinifera]|uniref:Uncharacterized protein n=1 Tax=Vitis vinifera TaxID=29760 RepID=A0A438DJR2_VITVI|nr:hypothetical protein CK203_093598 [Vitis vinifera]